MSSSHLRASNAASGNSVATCRVVVHLDLDCFYAQVEQRRLKIPADEPVAVQQWGSLLAVNYVARKFGVKRSMRCQYAIVAQCNEVGRPHVDTLGENRKPGKAFDRQHQKAILRRYRIASREIFAVLRRLAPLCEKAGVDEAFLDITQLAKERLAKMDVLSSNFCSDDANSATKVFGISQMEGIGKTAECDPDTAFPVTEDERLLCIGAMIANEIRRTIFQELQYTCSTGIATNKLLAKLASPLNKPDGQTLVAPRFVPLLMQHFPLRSVRGLGGKLGHQLEGMIRQLGPTSLPAPSVRHRPAQAGGEPQTRQEGEETAEKKMDITAQGFIDQFRSEDLVKHLGHDTAAFVVRVCSGDDGDEPVNEKKVEVKGFSCVKQFDQRSGDALLRLDQLEYWVRVLCEETILRCEDERVENKRFPMQLTFHSTRVGEKPKSRKLRIAQTTTIEELFKATMVQLRPNANSLFPCAVMAMHAKDFVVLDSTAVSSISSYFTKQQQQLSTNQDAAATEGGKGEDAQDPLEQEFKQFAAATQTRNGSSCLTGKRKKISSFFQTPTNGAEAPNDTSTAVEPSTASASNTDQDRGFQAHEHHQIVPSPSRKSLTTVDTEVEEVGEEEDTFAQFRSTIGSDGKQRPTFYCDRCLRTIAESRAEHQDFHFALGLSRSERSQMTMGPPPTSAPAAKKMRKSGPLDAFLKR
ncbi:DNA polymerase iota/dna damage inducible protein, partial [Globisporangium splendens]